MKSGHGRLILCDGTDLPIAYRLQSDQLGHWCTGTLIGDVRSADPGGFGEGLKARLDDGRDIALLVTGYSDRYISFVATFDVGARLDRENTRAEAA